MKEPKTKATKSLMDTMRELGQKSGVNVTDTSERGVRAIGFLGGVRRQNARRDSEIILTSANPGTTSPKLSGCGDTGKPALPAGFRVEGCSLTSGLRLFRFR
jgi:hypothetical protein